MPSTLLTGYNVSGAPFPLISGNYFSGQGIFHPIGGVQLRLDRTSSGNAYISLSGSTTVTSGGFFMSGGGRLDGMPMFPGDSYFIPKTGCGISGSLGIFVSCDPACSGQSRLSFEIF